MKRAERQLYGCKYCGARLLTDSVGKRCPTKNCQWEHGVKTYPTKRKSMNAPR